jgi:hypothetical protein
MTNRWCIVSEFTKNETVWPKETLYWCNGTRKDQWGNVAAYAKRFRTKREAEAYLVVVLAANFENIAATNIRTYKITDRFL